MDLRSVWCEDNLIYVYLMWDDDNDARIVNDN